ncbi:rCG24909 [Rattus norvegicus]|uniref:RCG24909 n=1 Tax=Rattus norvegicus TaxID=10116 RepID=A6JBX0_RAT|nr:rCG24909 [Rattus norvegicus]
MNVADRHGYGSEMQQSAIIVGEKKEMHLFVRIS